jgi:hypothetical protein
VGAQLGELTCDLVLHASQKDTTILPLSSFNRQQANGFFIQEEEVRSG